MNYIPVIMLFAHQIGAQIHRPHQRNDIHIFYNIFMVESRVSKTWSIINEQLDVLDEFASKNASVNVHLRYVSIGVPVTINATKYEHIADIQRVEHLSVGNEPNTLQHLFDFCVANPNETATYICNGRTNWC